MSLKRKQQTIKRVVELEGTGLHTGENVRLRMRPAEPNSGITFVRTDLPRKPRIPVTADRVISKLRRSAIASDGAEVQTLEHLMSALAALGIDNLEIEIDGTEVPGMDGSALPFYRIIKDEAQVVEQDAEVRPYRIKEPITVAMNDITLLALPANEGLVVSYVLDYDAPLLRSQYLSFELDEERYAKEIAPARTFCLASEVTALREVGLGKGANYENTLVMDGDQVVNNTLRFPDECVRHKILDLIGDLFLLGRPLIGQVLATKSGHINNMRMVQQIADQEKTDRIGSAARDPVLDIQAIQKILPHRYPMLLVDRIVLIDGTDRVVGLKNVSFNEPFFQGHWPDRPIMPGVLLIEAMAQVAGILIHQHLAGQARYAVLLSLDKVKLRKPVVPGDQVVIEARTGKIKNRTALIETEATVEGKIVAEAEMKLMLIDG